MNDKHELKIDLSVLQTETSDEYHAKKTQYLSSHQLIDFIKCPWLYYKKQKGLIPDTDSTAYVMGRAMHTRILEGLGKYEEQYVIGGPINPKTGKSFGADTKAFAEWADTQTKQVLTYSQAELIEMLSAGIAMNDEAVDLLLVGKAEGVVRAEYQNVPCQIRIDWLNPTRGIVDLKTCDNLDWFERDANRYYYQQQMVFYQSVLAEVIGQSVPIYFVVVEKNEPYRCGVWRMLNDAVSMARMQNESAIRRLRECNELDNWPTLYEEIRPMAAN